MYIVHIIKYEVHHYCVIISILLIMLAKNGYQNDNRTASAVYIQEFNIKISKRIFSIIFRINYTVVCSSDTHIHSVTTLECFSKA